MAKIDTSDFIFNIGFKKYDTFSFFDANYKIVIKLKAYYEKDGMTAEQIESYEFYLENKCSIQTKVESELSKLKYNKIYLKPTMLLINRNGEIALMIQDDTDLDDGIAVVIKPEFKVLSQDEYL